MRHPEGPSCTVRRKTGPPGAVTGSLLAEAWSEWQCPYSVAVDRALFTGSGCLANRRSLRPRLGHSGATGGAGATAVLLDLPNSDGEAQAKKLGNESLSPQLTG